MPETMDNTTSAPPPDTSMDSQALPAIMINTRPEHTIIKGRFNQYVSAFWTFVLPLFTTRYILQPLSELIGWTDEVKKPPAGSVSPNRAPISPLALKHPLLQRFYAISTGLVMLGATLFYGAKTLGDMRRTLSESLAYEFDKDPSKPLSLRDLLFRETQNDVVRSVRRNFFKYNLRRLAFVNFPFFSIFVPGLRERLSTENAVRWGVGFGASYLVTDVLSRKETFFEELQSFTDHKINQVGRVGEQITAVDLINLYERNARDYSPQSTFSDKINTPLWNQSMPVFDRMAQLMNQTYHPEDGKRSDFTTPKFIYLVGHKLIQPENPEQTLAYVEIANKYGIAAIKKVVAAMKSGAKLEDAIAPFPVSINIAKPEKNIDNQKDSKFAAGLGDTRNSMRVPTPPAASHAQKAIKSDTPVAAPGI